MPSRIDGIPVDPQSARVFSSLGGGYGVQVNVAPTDTGEPRLRYLAGEPQGTYLIAFGLDKAVADWLVERVVELRGGWDASSQELVASVVPPEV